jgi:hypothetical protein
MADSNLLGVSPQSFIAGGVVPINVLVMLDSTANQVVVTTGITSVAFGASLVSAASGGLVAVQQFGKAKLTATGAISLGAQVMPAAAGGGLIDTAAGATAVSIGIALQAAGASGDVIEVQLAVPPVKGPANA